MPSLRQQAAWFPHDERAPLPLPPPSPTLTNPDMVLPSLGTSFASPPRDYERPPSPSYLRHRNPSPTSESVTSEIQSTPMVARRVILSPPKNHLEDQRWYQQSRPQQQLGRIYLRASPLRDSFDSDAHTTSPSAVNQHPFDIPEAHRHTPPNTLGGSNVHDEFSSRNGGHRSRRQDPVVDDLDHAETESLASQPFKPYADLETGAEAQRKKEEDEYHSAVLSRRAEEILANAKKRLNVMEGNLRGARDLVAPLTAANLKRAASMGVATYAPAFGMDKYVESEAAAGQLIAPASASARKLQTKASSPTIGRDFSNHYPRDFGHLEIPERPYTSMETKSSMPPVVLDPPRSKTSLAPTPSLRGSRSVDSLGGSHGVGGPGAKPATSRDRPSHSKNSSELTFLEPLHEQDGDGDGDDDGGSDRPRYAETVSSSSSHQRDRPGERSSTRTSSLRDQMSSLKGRISSLQQRAREDSLHRQSMQSLRNSSPFNNALTPAQDLYRTQTPDAESAVSDAAQIGTRFTPSPAPSSHSSRRLRDGTSGTPGVGHNVFAEQAAAQRQQLEQARSLDVSLPHTPDAKQRRQQQQQPKTAHIATQKSLRKSSVGAVSSKSPSKAWSSSGESQESKVIPSVFSSGAKSRPSPGPVASEHDGYQADASSNASDTTSSIAGDSDIMSQSTLREEDDDNASVYEDARQSRIVAHEDREDAFDYEHIFIHSAMGIYKENVLLHGRGASDSEGSTSSGKTARGPGRAEEDEVDDLNDTALSNPDSVMYPLPTPETPERLRQIERNLHMRKFSTESISTINSFATAHENRGYYDQEPSQEPQFPNPPSHRYSSTNILHETSLRASSGNRPRGAPSSPTAAISQGTSHRNFSRSTSRPRPSTAVKQPQAKQQQDTQPPLPRRSTSSERADSGVSLHRHAASNISSITTTTTSSDDPLRQNGVSSTLLKSPPLPEDPVTTAVNALLSSTNHSSITNPRETELIALSLREKAALFAMLDALRKVLIQQQASQAPDPSSLPSSANASSPKLPNPNLGMVKKLESARLALEGADVAADVEERV